MAAEEQNNATDRSPAATPSRRLGSMALALDSMVSFAFPALAAVVLLLMALISWDASYLLWALGAGGLAAVGYWLTVQVPKHLERK